MKQIGILFQTDMVRAILDGRKTLTSRLSGLEEINERPDAWRYDWVNIHGDHLFFDAYAAASGHDPQDYVHVIKCRYGQAGDRLIGRETFWVDRREPKSLVIYAVPNSSKRMFHRYHGQEVRPCEPRISTDYLEKHEFWIRKPSIYMPYWASRLSLDVVRIWPSRLQDMTEGEAIAEGFEYGANGNPGNGGALDWYRALWDRINGKKHPWASNPWVWRIEFQLATKNAEQTPNNEHYTSTCLQGQ